MTTDLRQRIIASTGPDREIDASVMETFGYEIVWPDAHPNSLTRPSPLMFMGDSERAEVPPFTAQPIGIGHCIALMQSRLPEFLSHIVQMHDGFDVTGYVPADDCAEEINTQHPLLTHALLLSVLDAAGVQDG